MESRKLKFDTKIDIIDPSKDHYLSLDFSRGYIKDKKILNVGSWVGNYEFLVGQLPKEITSLEIEKEALRVAKKAGIRSRLVNGSILAAPFSNESFDVVTMWLVLEHLPKHTEEQACSEVKRILKKGGYFIFSTPNYHWLNNLLDPTYILIGHRHYKRRRLTNMLKRAGFRVEKLETKGKIIFLFSGIFFYIFKYLFRKKMPRFNWLERMCSKESQKRGFTDIYLVAKRYE